MNLEGTCHYCGRTVYVVFKTQENSYFDIESSWIDYMVSKGETYLVCKPCSIKEGAMKGTFSYMKTTRLRG